MAEPAALTTSPPGPRPRRPRTPAAARPGLKAGVLDIGTNSIHIVIAEIGPQMQFEIVGRDKEMARLGDGTLKAGWLPDEKADEAIRIIKGFAQLARQRGVTRLTAVATAAIREAGNGGAFLTRVLKETGIRVRSITGEEEARLIYLAVRHYLDLSTRKALIVDMGGGSVEIIVGDTKEAQLARSLKLGSARLKDLYIPEYPVPKDDHERLHEHLTEALAPTLTDVKKAGFDLMVGTSGTFINLAAIIHQRITGQPLSNPLGFSITRAQIKELHRDLGKSTDEERAKLKGIDPARMDILLPGACLLLEVMDALGVYELTLCDRALREGVLLDYILKNPKKIEAQLAIPNPRLRSVIQLAQRCEYDAAHAEQVSRLSRKLFESFDLADGMHPAASELLDYAATLHDIGYHVGFDQHHKHAWYLIKNSELNGFTPDEIEIIACVARFHRKRPPRRRDPLLRSLDKMGRRTVRALAAVLRVADALDRSHFGLIQDLRVVHRGSETTVHLITKGDPAVEAGSAEERKALLERVSGRSIRFALPLKR